MRTVSWPSTGAVTGSVAMLLLSVDVASDLPWFPPRVAAALEVLLVVTLGVAILGDLVSREWKLSRRSVSLCCLILVIVMYAILIGPDTDYATRKSLQVLFVAAPIFLVGTVIGDVRDLIRGSLWTLAILGCLASVAALQGSHASSIDPVRTSLPGGSPILLARVVAGGLLALLVLAGRQPIARVVTGVLGAGLFVVLLTTGSRGPLVALIVALGVYIALRGGRPHVLARVAIFAVIAVIGINLAQAYAHQAESRPVDRIVAFSAGIESDSPRVDLASDALRAASTRPLGAGWGSFPEVTHQSRYSYPHNVVLEILLELGWLPTLLLVSSLMYTASRVGRHCLQGTGREATPVAAFLVFYLVNALFSGDVVLNDGLWLFFGASIGLSWNMSHAEADRSTLDVSV